MIEQHGGLNEVMSRIGKRAEGGRIDGFTLWWPERCRQIGAHSTKGTWCAEVVRGPEPFSQEAAPSASCGRPSRQDARIRTGKGGAANPSGPHRQKGTAPRAIPPSGR